MCTFADVKHIIDYIRLLLGTAILLVAGSQIAMGATAPADRGDFIEVSLLTCEPSQKIYGLYGHTALRFHDNVTGDDWSFNYGVFDFNKPFFVMRFLFGLTDYELGVVPMSVFREEYTRMGCQVTEQVINLNLNEKARLFALLQNNYLPQNRVYRYNYFYDNCTTRARNIIERCIDGHIDYIAQDDPQEDRPSYREMIHAHTAAHPWAAVGNDLCLGFKADRTTNWREAQFLPENLMRDFADASIIGPDGTRRPLVLQTRTAVKGGIQMVEPEFPLSPRACAAILLAVTLVITLIEVKRRKVCTAFDLLLMTVQGLAGIIVTAMLFSEHPTTSTNLQALVLNPLPLVFLWAVGRGYKTRYWKIAAILTAAFLAGAFIQDYAEGMVLVALSLLVRCGMHLYGFRASGINDVRRGSRKAAVQQDQTKTSKQQATSI